VLGFHYGKDICIYIPEYPARVHDYFGNHSGRLEFNQNLIYRFIIFIPIYLRNWTNIPEKVQIVKLDLLIVTAVIQL
jgi:hypothetical protein